MRDAAMSMLGTSAVILARRQAGQHPVVGVRWNQLTFRDSVRANVPGVAG